MSKSNNRSEEEVETPSWEDLYGPRVEPPQEQSATASIISIADISVVHGRNQARQLLQKIVASGMIENANLSLLAQEFVARARASAVDDPIGSLESIVAEVSELAEVRLYAKSLRQMIGQGNQEVKLALALAILTGTI